MFKNISMIFEKLLSFINQRVDETGAQYIAFGIFGLLNYPLSHLMWYKLVPQPYSPLSLRVIAACLSIPLILKNYWPEKLKRLLPLYWYITLLYSLPFFGTYMLLKNHLTVDWLMNAMLGLFLFTLLVDWLSFVVLISLGIGLGWMCYKLTGGQKYTVDIQTILLAIYMYLFIILIVAIFARNRENASREKLFTMQTLGASIAHELRTPLRAIQAGASGVRQSLLTLIESYKIARQAKLPVPYLAPPLFNGLLPAFNSVEAEAQSAFTFIDMLLMKVSQSDIESMHRSVYSMKQCVEEALRRYPFNGTESSLVSYHFERDFYFKGNDLFMTHVIFNLLKNALYYVRAAGKGEITIRFESDHHFNYLHFKDTGKGISKKILPHVFDRFFTRTRHGTGIGLAFCKLVMKSFGGDILCRSVENEYAEFVLSFPILKKEIQEEMLLQESLTNAS